MEKAATPVKKADLALIYCEDPTNDPEGGQKPRVRTLTESYLPNLSQFANGWHLVSNDKGRYNYKIKQKDLPTISPSCWILVGESQGENHWTSARMRVGDFLEANGVEGWPAFGPPEFVDMAPHQPGNINHITDNSDGTGTGWAYNNKPIVIKVVIASDPHGEIYKASDMTYQWRISAGSPVFCPLTDVQAPTITFFGRVGDVARLTVTLTHTPTGKEVTGTLVIVGQEL